VKRLFWSLIVSSAALAPMAAQACPANHHKVCVLPRPWGGCAQSVCVPNVPIPVPNPFPDIQRAIEDKAFELAVSARDEGAVSDRTDCVIIVTASLTAWGASQGGLIGSAIGGVAGGAAARMGCRKAFP
jgi:hypothetical protein